ncbi:MAG: twin-arginine translocation signal domain-containing protein [Thermodesulfobacteriota bacterium]
MLHDNTEEVTRRDFLRGAGASAAGLAVLGSAGLLMKNTVFAKQAAPAKLAAGLLPYVKLDPDEAMETAYKEYLKGYG